MCSSRISGSHQIKALKAITINSAYQHLEEKTKGLFELGKLAELVILDNNSLTVVPKSLKAIETIKRETTI